MWDKQFVVYLNTTGQQQSLSYSVYNDLKTDTTGICDEMVHTLSILLFSSKVTVNKTSPVLPLTLYVLNCVQFMGTCKSKAACYYQRSCLLVVI